MRSAAKYIWLFIVVAFVGGFLLAQTSGLLGRTPLTPTTAVATVNGHDILYQDWQQRVQQATQQASRSGRSLTQDEVRQIENETLDEMIMQVLLQQEYRRRGITVSDEELREEILGGAKFEDVARRESADSASAVNGGDLGRGVRGRFVPQFEQAAYK